MLPPMCGPDDVPPPLSVPASNAHNRQHGLFLHISSMVPSNRGLPSQKNKEVCHAFPSLPDRVFPLLFGRSVLPLKNYELKAVFHLYVSRSHRNLPQKIFSVISPPFSWYLLLFLNISTLSLESFRWTALHSADSPAENGLG